MDSISGKCVLNVMIAHDVFSERIAKAPNAEEEQWEKIKLIVTDSTLTGACLASGYSYAQNLLSQTQPVNNLILCLKCNLTLITAQN